MYNLFSELIQGERLVQKKLYDLLYPHLCGFAVRFVGNMEDAKDIASDAFTAYWEKKDEFVDPIQVFEFLFQHALDGCKDFFARKEAEGQLRAELKHLTAHDQFRLDDEIIQLELLEMIRRIIDTLPSRRREAIRLFLEGFAVAVIADKMNTKEQTIRNTKTQAVEKLREILKKRGLIPIIALILKTLKL